MSHKDRGAPQDGPKAAATPPRGDDRKRLAREARLAAALRANLRRRKAVPASDKALRTKDKD